MPTPALFNFLSLHPRVSFRLVTAATAEPVTTADAMAHATIDDTNEAAYVATLVSTARAQVEMMTGRSLTNEVRRMDASAWSQFYDLDRTPIASISSVTYFPEDYGNAVTVDPSYYLLSVGEPDRVIFKDTFNFPALADRQDAITVNYACSTGTIPAPLAYAIKVLVNDAFDLRTEQVTGTTISKSPRLQQILEAHRIGGFAV